MAGKPLQNERHLRLTGTETSDTVAVPESELQTPHLHSSLHFILVHIQVCQNQHASTDPSPYLLVCRTTVSLI